jgi:ornithine lipid ester-linked acyl 2-hydroxylase
MRILKLFEQRLDRASSRMALKVLGWLESSNARFSRVGNTPFFRAEQFPWALEVESNWGVIREELMLLLPRFRELPDVRSLQTGAMYQLRSSDEGMWRTFIFYDHGRKNLKSCSRCPGTAEILERIPGMVTALFSILGPHSHIPAHRGPYNGVLRCHLGLKVPRAGRCQIRVGSDSASWEEGKSIIFDDAFNHEVWNDTTEHRAILFVDIVRPLPFPIPLSMQSSLAARSKCQIELREMGRPDIVMPGGRIVTSRCMQASRFCSYRTLGHALYIPAKRIPSAGAREPVYEVCPRLAVSGETCCARRDLRRHRGDRRLDRDRARRLGSRRWRSVCKGFARLL